MCGKRNFQEDVLRSVWLIYFFAIDIIFESEIEGKNVLLKEVYFVESLSKLPYNVW
jgi:hypothetical protein